MGKWILELTLAPSGDKRMSVQTEQMPQTQPHKLKG